MSVQVEQKSYEMPPREGISIAFFLTVADIERSARYYEKIFDARILSLGGQTVKIPANAPHFFTNTSGMQARMLCMCTPAGQEEFFLAIGDRVETRTTPAP